MCGNKGSWNPSPGNVQKNRGCTDIVCLVIFIIFIIGMICIAGFSLVQGNAMRLVYGYDSFGNTCNMKNQKLHENLTLSGQDLSDRKFVFFANVWDPLAAMQLCVKECPNKKLNTQQEVQDYSKSTGVALCRYDISVKNYTKIHSSGYATTGPCPKLPVMKSHPILNRCVPDFQAFVNTTEKIIGFLNIDDIYRKVLGDMYRSWKEMLALCFVALGVALLMVLLIRFAAAIIVWLIVILAGLGSIALTAFLWWTYASIKNDLDKKTTRRIPLLNVDISNEMAFLVLAIIATVFTVIILLLLIFMRKGLSTLVELFKDAGKCLASIPLLLIQPVWTFLVLILFFVCWVVVLGHLSTSGHPVPDEKRPGFVKFEDWAIVRYMWWYHLVGLIWISEFILACQQMVIAGAVSTWYFAKDKNQGSCAIGRSICRITMHHLGSLAMGASIITLVKLPRWILMYIHTKTKDSQNECAKCCMKCCICCLKCLEKVLKYINRNAYIVIAMEGRSFWSAAVRVFTILASNATRVLAVNSVGDFILFLGKIGVMAITAAVSVVWLKTKGDLHFYPIPVVLLSIFAYFIAHCFLSIYEMVIDTLLLCYCVDEGNKTDGDELDKTEEELAEKVEVRESLRAFLEKSDNVEELRKKHDEPDAGTPLAEKGQTVEASAT